MITKDNLPDLLKALGFNKRGTTYDKGIGSAKLAVKFTKGEIGYLDGLTVNQKTNYRRRSVRDRHRPSSQAGNCAALFVREMAWKSSRVS